MKCQFTLTVAEGKRLIAKAAAKLPAVEKALKNGKILLKGGTTVSAIAEELCGEKMRISGRITSRGTVGAGNHEARGDHILLINKGEPISAHGRLMEIAREMGPDDVAINGANIFDLHGQAGMMAGKDLAGEAGAAYPVLEAEGVHCIIAVGLEKLSPVSIMEASHEGGRKAADWAMGMAVGLVPIPGRIITEMQALSILGYERHWLIGRGGIDGAEGSSTFIVEDAQEELEKLLRLVEGLKGAAHSGTDDSLYDCSEKCPPTHVSHLCCKYAGKARIKIRKGDI